MLSLFLFKKEVLTTGVQKEYNYDRNGNKTLFKLKKDNVEQINTVYSYDRLDRVQSVTNANKTSVYTYDKNSRLLTDVTDGFTTSYTYNEGGLVKGIQTQKNGTQIQSHSYQYLPDANVSQKNSTVGQQTAQYSYQYDDAGRLTKEQIGNNVSTFTYDSFGNRQSMVKGDATSTYTYDANNRLLKTVTSCNDIDEITSYMYDNNGNQIARYYSTISPNGGAKSYEITSQTDGTEYELYGYDSYNRLVSYTNGIKNASYTYNADNLRQGDGSVVFGNFNFVVVF